MNRESWQRVREHFETARGLASGERPAYLDRELAEDPDARAKLAALLAADDQAGGFLATKAPAADPSAAERAALGRDAAVGPYRILDVLGEGGFGVVYLAEQSRPIHRRVALKVLKVGIDAKQVIQRFEAERQALALMDHPNIAQVFDAGETARAVPYFVMEYVPGVAITEYCDSRRLRIRERLELFLQVCDAVQHAHQKGVIHRDIKPSNVLVADDGDRTVVKVIDFGVVKALDQPLTDRTMHTREGVVLGTLGYMSPEQAGALEDGVDTRSDIYSLGALLYELLVGELPFEQRRLREAAWLEALHVIREEDPPRFSVRLVAMRDTAELAASRRGVDRRSLARQLRGELEWIALKALEKEPSRRYAAASELSADIQRFLTDEPVLAGPPSRAYRVRKFVRRHRGAVAAALVASLALASTTLVAITQLVEARRQRDEARAQTQRADAFNNIITSLLSQVGPAGRALSPEELLDRAVEEMEVRYSDDPAFLVGMLIRISGRYFDLRNNHKEHATLVKAEQIARRSGDAALLFDVQVNTVETELAAGRTQQAQARIESARQLLVSIKEPPPLDDYLRAEAEVAKAGGDLLAAIGYLERARRVLEVEGRTHGNSYGGILSTLAAYNALAGNPLEAHHYALQLVEVDKRHGREQTVGGIIARTSLATSFYNLGEVQRARVAFEEAIPELAAAESTWASHPSAAYRYGEVISRLGRHQLAMRLIEGAVTALDRNGNQFHAIRARINLARARLRAGQMRDVASPLDAAVAMMSDTEAAYQAWLGEVGRVRAEVALAQGRLDESVLEAGRALERLGYPTLRRGAGLGSALLLQSRVQLAQGRVSEAAATASEALQSFERNARDPGGSADVGEALLALAHAQTARGDVVAATASLQRATDCLRRGLGPDHPMTIQAQLLAQQQH